MSTEKKTQRPSRVLVTGAAGFIGSNFVHWVLKHWPEVEIVALDALAYAGNPANLKDLSDNSRFSFVEGNICDRNLVAKLLDDGINAIVNFAAHTHVDRSLMEADEFVATNVGGVQVMLDLIKDRSSIRFLQISTDEVYGSQKPDEFADESSPLVPRNPYSATKTGADVLAMAYHYSFSVDVVITRCCNNYGPYHYPEKLIPLFVTNLMDDVKVPLYGDGLNFREWIHVEDHCSAVARVLESGRSGEIYNVSQGEGLANVDLTNLILESLNKDQTYIRYVEDRPGHDRRYALKADKIMSELNWQPVHNFKEGLSATVQWYRGNESWWRPIKSGEYRRYYESQYGKR